MSSKGSISFECNQIFSPMCFKAVLELKKYSHNHLKANLFNWKSKLLCCSSIGILSKLLHALLIFFTQNCPPLSDSIGTMGHTKTMIADFFCRSVYSISMPYIFKENCQISGCQPLEGHTNKKSRLDTEKKSST